MRKPLVFALLFFISINASAQNLPRTDPGSVGVSADRLDRINQVFQRHIDEGRIAGVTTLVARYGQVVHYDAIGNRDAETSDAMKPDSIFRIYSMTKPITSVAAMMLLEQGQFLLTDPVSMYLPELAGVEVLTETRDADTGEVTYSTVPANREITIQDLFRHTSGFVYGVSPSSELDKRYFEAGVLLEATNLQETVEKLGELPLLFQPGTRWNYGVNTDVLARLVEVVSGQRFDTFLKQQIFEPLAMVDTHFELPESKRDRLAQLYTRQSETKLIPDPDSTRSYMGKPGYYSGGAGLMSTAADYWRFCQMLLNGGELDGHRLLSPKSVELMSMDHLGEVPGGFPWAGGSGFGLGFQVILDPGAFGHSVSQGLYSWGGAAGTGFWIDKEEQLIGVFMIQILPHGGLNYSSQYRNLVYQSLETSESYGAPVPLSQDGDY